MAMIPWPWPERRRAPSGSSNGTRERRRWRRSRPRPHVEPASPLREAPPRPESLDTLLAEFTERWRRGESPRAEQFLDRLDPDASGEVVELVYHEFCLTESAGLDPDPLTYLDRFPAHRERLARLFGLHELLREPDRPTLWEEPVALPENGDAIGPYQLLRELGRGSFARVFLAEQSDLEDRLVVVKVSTRPSPEPQLLARARHAAHRRGPAARRGGRGGPATALHAVPRRRDPVGCPGERIGNTDAGPAPGVTCWPIWTASPRRSIPPGPAALGAGGSGRAVARQGPGVDRRPAGRGPRPRPTPGRHPRRPEALEHPAGGRRPADAARFQPGRGLATARR